MVTKRQLRHYQGHKKQFAGVDIYSGVKSEDKVHIQEYVVGKYKGVWITKIRAEVDKMLGVVITVYVFIIAEYWRVEYAEAKNGASVLG